MARTNVESKSEEVGMGTNVGGSMKRRVIILMLQPDGSWITDGLMYRPSRANKLVSENRILFGIQSRTFPVKEYAALHPEVELEEAI